MTDEELINFEASCPHCATPVEGITYPRALWGMGLAGSGPTVVCPGCKQQIATRISPNEQGRDRLILKMLTLPVGVSDSTEVEARPLD
jgi:hypothetical protein